MTKDVDHRGLSRMSCDALQRNIDGPSCRNDRELVDILTQHTIKP